MESEMEGQLKAHVARQMRAPERKEDGVKDALASFKDELTRQEPIDPAGIGARKESAGMLDRLALLSGGKRSLVKRDHPIRVVGIDLGTTNCTVAELVWEPGMGDLPNVRCIPIDQDTTQGR
jgi:hypothetical protein